LSNERAKRGLSVTSEFAEPFHACALPSQSRSECLVLLLPDGQILRPSMVASFAGGKSLFGSFSFGMFKDAFELRRGPALPRLRQLVDEDENIS
jgi:hypothetical protein